MASFMILMRRDILKAAVQEHSGAYILPEENQQTNPARKIASIHLDGLTGIGQTEEQAQKDWLAGNARKAIRAIGASK